MVLYAALQQEKIHPPEQCWGSLALVDLIAFVLLYDQMGVRKFEQGAGNAFTHATLNHLPKNMLVLGHIALRQIPKHGRRKA